MSKVGIVIPFYKNQKQLDRCKEALDCQSVAIGECYIHDNSSNNIGFTKAVNKGLYTFMGRAFNYAIVLNQDCYLKEDSVEKMVGFMDENPNCAIGGIKQISDSDRDQIIHGGCGQAFPSGMHITGSVKVGHCDENKRMPWVNGACIIVNLSLLPYIGLMDENYFLIGSDSDFCYTARARGFDVWYIADAECFHEVGVSQNANAKTFSKEIRQDMTHFRDKWVGSNLYKELTLEVF